jgi:HAE1 family hydrophobic/amphiphilic exporter-1
MRLSLSGDTNLFALRNVAEDVVKRRLEVIDGVASVQIGGGLEEELQVAVDEARLARLGLALPQVIARLQQENVDLVGGAIHEGDIRYLVRTRNAFASVAEIGSMVVGYQGRTAILLRDVAVVRQSYRDRHLITRLNGHETIELALYKRVDSNTVSVAKRVRERLRSIQNKLDDLPYATRLNMISNQADFIQQAIREVLKTAWLGGLLAMLVLYLFLHDVRSTFIIGSAIPVSVIGSFLLMYLLEISLNILSLGGLALGIGMLVDNAIVVLESIERQRTAGMSRRHAALQGTIEVGQAITASTLTTVCVFIPLIFVRGVAGQLFNDLALTVSCAMLTSLAVAITLIPMLAAIGAEPEPIPEGTGPMVRATAACLLAIGRGLEWLASPLTWLLARLERAFNQALQRFRERYLAALDGVLRHRWLALCLVTVGCGVVMYLGMFLQQEFMPELHPGEVIVDITLAVGTPLAATAQRVEIVEQLAIAHPLVSQVYSSIGRQQRSGGIASAEREHVAQLHVRLKPEATVADEAQVLSDLRRELLTQPGLQVQFDRPSYFSVAMPLEIEIRGHELETLRQVSQAWGEALARFPGLTDLRSSMAPGEPELHIVFDRQKLAVLGLDVADIATLIKQNVQGEVATALTRGERDVDIRVRAQNVLRLGRAAVEQLRINPQGDVPVTLGAVAQLQVRRGPSEIQHEDLQRVAVIAANVQGHSLGHTVQQLQRWLARQSLPPGIVARVRGQSTEMTSAFRSLGFALALATFLVYLVLASQFESLFQPLMVLFAVPLGISGAVMALWLTGQSLNVLVCIGGVLLVGIVVNNAIVLVDYANQCRHRGLSARESVCEAAAVRLRPILMTASTTVLGLLPMALGLGEGSELRAPLAITVIGGLSLSTLLLLWVMPAAYVALGAGRRHAVDPRPAPPLEQR